MGGWSSCQSWRDGRLRDGAGVYLHIADGHASEFRYARRSGLSSGWARTDAFGGYDGIYATGHVTEVACWPHARRKFYDARVSKPGSAYAAMAWIGRLYEIEGRARELDAASRCVLRHQLIHLPDPLLARAVLEEGREPLEVELNPIAVVALHRFFDQRKCVVAHPRWMRRSARRN